MPHHAQARINRIIEDCGGDVDYGKLQKFAQKQGWTDNN
jgi:hypothetical protein